MANQELFYSQYHVKIFLGNEKDLKMQLDVE